MKWPFTRQHRSRALSDAEWKRRVPVWIAFSDLYLDNETQESDYKYIARTCVESSYTRDELRSILFDEVGPAFCFNLLSVAGEWAMFSDDEVQRVMRKQLRFMWRFPLGHRKFLTEYTNDHWDIILTWLDRPVEDLQPPAFSGQKRSESNARPTSAWSAAP